MKTIKEVYLEQFTKNCLDAVELTKKKNADYSFGDDAFGNFRASIKIAGVTLPQGILVRISDKLSRIKNLMNRPGNQGEVSDETLEDTIRDLMVYSNILLCWYQMKEPLEDTYYQDETPDVIPETNTAGETKEPILKKLFNWENYKKFAK